MFAYELYSSTNIAKQNSNIKITEHPDLEVYYMNWFLDNKINIVLFENLKHDTWKMLTNQL